MNVSTEDADNHHQPMEAQMSDNYDYTEWTAPLAVADYAGDFVLPEPGMYTFRLVEKGEDKPMDPKYDKTGEKRRAQFYFEIVDDEDYKDVRVMQFFTISFNEKAALTPFIEAGVGRKLEGTDRIGWRPNPNDPSVIGIENIEFRAMLTHDKKDDGRVFPKLSSPIPAKKGRAKKATVAEDEAPF